MILLLSIRAADPKGGTLRLRVQRLPIEAPEDDPFRHDRLARKESASALTQIVESIDGPCVLALDAGWGNGKTTFVNMWSQSLRDQGFVVAHFNAWATDYCGDPFVALSTELTDSIPVTASGVPDDKVNALKQAAGKVVRRLAVEAIRRATAGVVDLDTVLDQGDSAVRVTPTEQRITVYRDSRTSLDQFKESLKDVAHSLSQGNKNRPLVVMIDELDRCRPAYAVELLEVSKHIFDVDRIVFVLSVNRTQLEHSVKALYGSDFDARGYLRRFFDLDFRLPDANRNELLDHVLGEIDIAGALSRSIGTVQSGDGFLLQNMVHAMFSGGNLSVRDTEQCLCRLGLVTASFGDAERQLVVPATAAVVLRSIDSNLYYQFARRQTSDLEVIESIFSRPDMATANRHRSEAESNYAKGIVLFEAALVGATYEMAQSEHKAPYSALLQKYRREVGAEDLDNVPRNKRQTLAGQVLTYSRYYRSNYRGFMRAIDRIELISAGFDFRVNRSGQ